MCVCARELLKEEFNVQGRGKMDMYVYWLERPGT